MLNTYSIPIMRKIKGKKQVSSHIVKDNFVVAKMYIKDCVFFNLTWFELTLDCWKAEPEERPSFEQLITRMDDMMTQDTPYVYLNKDYENDVSNIEAKPETDQRHEWLMLVR